ncbi:ARM repeat-containing protein [Xylaria nigripes]|nr:ARM repeat-containing protein [Xylaria nigripes]
MATQPINGDMGMGGRDAPIATDDNQTSAVLSKIQQALEVVYNPYSSNDERKDAQSFLESVKDTSNAPTHGFHLASDKTQSPVVRHYALSLLEHAIKHKWAEYAPNEAQTLRSWVLQLSRDVARGDPVYLRNKIAQLWVEIAKRSWGTEWMDMDSLLVDLWQVPDSAVHKEFVLAILESLSDIIFNSDDMVVQLREKILSRASVEIFTPNSVLLEAFPNREAGPEVRCGEEGWLTRIVGLLRQCLSGDLQNNEDLRNCTLRCFAVLLALMPWVIPKSIFRTEAVPIMCEGLRASNIEVQKASLEALHALYSRASFHKDEFLELVVPLYDAQYVTLFRQLFEWSVIDPDDLDDDKYQFCKKLSELISYLGNNLERRFSALPTDPSRVDLMGFLQLLLLIAQNQSLVVSIPVIVTWCRLLGHESMGPNIAETAGVIGPLLEVCSARLIRYESLPEDSADPTLRLLFEDTDTYPERHLFLGNYRRYASQVIESIVHLKVSDAIQHILGQTENVLVHLYDGLPPLDVENYSKVSQPVLMVDARATVIEAALKGYSKWRAQLELEEKEDVPELNSLSLNLETWCNRLLEMKFEDPLVRKRILQLLVAFSTSVLDKNPTFMLKVLEHILVTWPTLHPKHKVYSDAIKDLQGESMVELQRLAAKMPDHLLDVYDQIAAKVNEMVASGTVDDKRQITYQTFLFTIVHRSRRLDQATKVQRLRAFLEPIRTQWHDPRLQQGLSSYAAFSDILALNKAQDYVMRKRMNEIQDWGSVALDQEGKALQTELESRLVTLPLRLTKSFLTCSVDKIEKGHDPFRVSSILWQDYFSIILPELLKFLSYAHSSHSPNSWTILPPEMRSVVNRIMTDRFWQSGISEGSKDDFYARVLEKKHTFEGLASTIRGSIRFVRESCYAIIYCMTRLDMQFYGFGELPGPLSHALLAEASSLSAHQLINLLNLVRYLVDNCPVPLRDHFLPPILESCFQQMHARVNGEWMKLDQQQVIKSAGDDLTEEMKNESILRQLTYTSVMLVADFLDPARKSKYLVLRWLSGANFPDKPSEGQEDSDLDLDKYPSLRNFCLMHSSIVEPLLVFCTRVIQMKDTRCCSIMLRVLKTVVPEFGAPDATNPLAGSGPDSHYQHNSWVSADTASVIRQYISTDITMACVASLHEPYFVEQQKELASLIATILVSYSPMSSTARDVLVSLPNIKQEEVDKGIEFMMRSNPRGQRAVVLELLRELKGVSVSEMGKLTQSIGLPSSQRNSRKSTRSTMAQEFMTTRLNDAETNNPNAGNSGNANANNESGLDGLAGLFEI